MLLHHKMHQSPRFRLYICLQWRKFKARIFGIIVLSAVLSVELWSAGGGLGLAMGLFLGALDNPLMQDQMTGRQQLIYQAKQMGQRSWSSCKAFAVMGFVFSAAECVVEKARAKHDITNTVVAGCVTGGAISARGGPKATCVGCAGFAAFSVVIEKFLERHT
ncbi:mitochondrial import inner membrane translocase subunit TIM22-4 isoform X2 [Salvia miltiorrhiza]|uniref:mitochondrial import inner membrane translocase subunit TIM22-4 isoform X2 n=1 Tax=Salvia miltiorrhiza TaxID=226208 RepID=UPI0025AD4390|nr:mitochondrial import inner membrane translocase subunit TIM22-4 isoform X2 [Salvia miltiorrhiza]XP_057784756.1 mitochondrial import inner membrane translocase subunit TIM22-4 isoform X2 [Salvia miltiorrhiza]XP_057784757.1 mitochondrial import inner membrane translocase subunit TIM22-4 isoform X2 [Salvia miltiorrhiza]XP_057784758.1 mitochondrial import inner membrane translocase subunit TIM22-4 isoform X2 [Salvia miltiorrhiza]XP_057784759.1 mitochondrial import inner membrane translocase subu